MAEPVLCPVMPELVEVLRQPGGLVTSEPARIWLAPDNVLHVEETDERPFRDLANAVADYIEGRIDRVALGQALVAAANALGTDRCNITPPETGSDVQQYDGETGDG